MQKSFISFFVKLGFSFILIFSIVQQSIGQVQEVRYQIRYNNETCLWDYFIITVGEATGIAQRAQFNAQYSFVVPTGTSVGSLTPNLPIQNNQTGNGTGNPTVWDIGTPAINPGDGSAMFPFTGTDIYPVTPNLSPASFFNNIAQNDTLLLFSIDIGLLPDCGDGIRPFINGVDPGPNYPGTGGGNFNNGYTLGGITQLYVENLPTIVPPSPVNELEVVCQQNTINIDLTSMTSLCQGPLTYEWEGPAGFSSTDEDVLIAGASSANNGTYSVTVTDIFGCTTVSTVLAEVQPDAGLDGIGCPGETTQLMGSPANGTWTAQMDNPAGATLTDNGSGNADVDFLTTADGVFNFIYTTEVCSDTVALTISDPDAGIDPDPVTCFSSGTATLSAVGTGVWTIDPSSPGTAVIADPMSANTTVSMFSQPGTYTLIWDIGGCTDEVEIIVNENCDCMITNNSLTPPDPNDFCDSSGAVLIDGAPVPEPGSYLWESNMDGSVFGSAPGANTTEDYTTVDLTVGVHEFRRIFTTSTGVICSDTSNIVTINVFDSPGIPANIMAVPQEICLGESTIVSVVGDPSAVFTWSVSDPAAGLMQDTDNDVMLTPTVAGTYTITVFQTVDGCPSGSISIDIFVNDIPPTPVSGDFTLIDPTECSGTDGSITISGFVPNSDFTIFYSEGGAMTSAMVTSDGAGNITITNLDAGTYSDFSIESDLGCISGVFAGPVLLMDPELPPNPSGLVAMPSPACLGETIDLIADPIPGGIFNWSVSSPNAGLGMSTSSVNELNPTAPGLYTVFLSVTINGCTSVDTTVGVQVLEAPITPTPGTVTGTNPTVCGGDDGFITLSGYDPNASFDISYTANGVATMATISSDNMGNLTIPMLTEGVYAGFEITNFSGCTSGMFTGTISLADPGSPDAPLNIMAVPNPLCLGESTTISVDNVPGVTFNWSASSPDLGLVVSNSNIVTATPTAAGSYAVSVSVTLSGCTSMSTTIDIQVGDTPPTPIDPIFTDPTECSGMDGTITFSGFTPGTDFLSTFTIDGVIQTVMVTAEMNGDIIIPGLSAGTYTDFIVSNDAGCPSETFVGPISLVDPESPDAPTGLVVNPNPICQGETTTITADMVPNATYTWTVVPSDAGLMPSTTNEVEFIPTTDGIFMVMVTVEIDGCVSAPSTPINVIVSPSPNTPTIDDVVDFMNPTDCMTPTGSVSIGGFNPSETFEVQFDSVGITVSRIFTADVNGIIVLDNIAAGTYSNFVITNGIGCSSGVFAGPVTLSDPGAPDAPANLIAMPNPACLGETIDLMTDDIPGATFEWAVSSPDAGLSMSTTNTATLMPTATGVYTVVVSVSLAGCVSPSSTIEVEVFDIAPTITNVTSTDLTDCNVDDGTITISSLTPSTDYILEYMFQGGTVVLDITTDINGEFTLMDLGVGEYSNFLLTNNAGCDGGVFAGPITLSAPLAPNAPTGVTAMPSPICLGETIDLMADFVTDAVYTWTIDNMDGGLVASTTNMTTMTPVSPGTYVVNVSLTINGCQSPSSSVMVEVADLPPLVTPGDVMSTNPTVCDAGDGTITFSGFEPNMDFVMDFFFNGSPGPSPVLTSNAAGEIILTGLSSGIYSDFRFTNENGCSSEVSTVSIELSDPGAPLAPMDLTASENPVCLGETIELNVTNNPGAEYEWSVMPTGGLVASTTNMTTYTPTLPGIYTVSVTQTVAGCMSLPATITIQVLEFCNNPDFGVTYTDLELEGDLSTNDNVPMGGTYEDITPVGTNPTGDLPVINTNGTYTFTSSVPGEYYFTVEACNPTSISCEEVPLSITVLSLDDGVDNPPVANTDYSAINSGGSIQINILDNDVCQSFPNCTLGDVTIIVSPTAGTYNPTTGIYTSNAGFVGVDSFLYEVCQDPMTTVSCDQEYVYIDVYDVDVSTFTSGLDDYNQTPLNTPLITTSVDGVLSNDIDPEGQTLVVSPQNTGIVGVGDLMLNSDGSYTFTPEMDYVGPASFPYQVCRLSDPMICDSATLHLLVEPMAAAGEIGACVFEDVDGNGIFNFGEPGVEGVEVNLFSSMGDLIASTTTDFAGNYIFEDVLQGEYFLEFVPINDLQFTLPNVGAEANDSDVDGTFGFGTTNLVTLIAGDVIDDVKAGLFECIKVGDNVWYDTNMNDIFDDNENGINGLRVFLWQRIGGSFTNVAETTTGQRPGSPSDDGYFEFCVAPGEYFLEFILPPSGLVQAVPFQGNDSTRDSDVNNANGPGTTSTFTLEAGTPRCDFGAGYYPEGAVGNLVWFDENMDGVQNPDEQRVGGVLVEAYDANSFELLSKSVTNDEGIYRLDSLDKREVYFKFTPPGETVATIPDVGLDAIDSDVDHTFGLNTTRMFSIQPDSYNENIDFGLAFGALPVRWVSVDVKEVNEGHEITWVVEQEIQVDGYEILRRHESEEEYTPLNSERVRANGSLSRSTYSYVDEGIEKSGIYYYRIKQYDLDEKFNFSRIVSFNSENFSDFAIFPNPTSSDVTIQLSSKEDSSVKLSVVNAQGQVMRRFIKPLERGENTIQIDLSEFTSGVYNLIFDDNGSVTTHRIIKID